MRVLTCDPKLEILGVNFHVWLNNVESDAIIPALEKHGLTNFQDDVWYPAHKWLEVLNELAQITNLSSACVAIGLSIGQTVPLPPGMTVPTLPEVLNAWDGMYHFMHRGADAGQIVIEKISDKHYNTRHTVIYPDDMSYGLLYGYGRRFLPPKTQFTVYYDDNIQRMDKGGQYTDIHIEW